MSVVSRKQREIQEREKKLIQIGRELLLKDGLHGLKLDRVADIAEYSRGTIYQHFRSKEDLLAAMAIESAQRRYELFERASQFAVNPVKRSSPFLWPTKSSIELSRITIALSSLSTWQTF